MKAPFRFFRGELNGFYLLNALTSRNAAVAEILNELVYQAKFAWKLESEITDGEMAIRDEDIIGLAKFAGVFKPIQYRQNTTGSITFTESKIVGGAQRSERGLFSMLKEKFEFIRTEKDDYETDISVEASSARRETMVPPGAVPVGYVPMGVNIFREDGSVITENILSAPPTDGTPYVDYYGPKYLFYQETFNGEAEMPIELFKSFFECVMRLRYNGVSVKEFLNLTKLLCEDYVYDIEIVPQMHYSVVYYMLNLDSKIEGRTGKIAAWDIVVTQRFKNFVLIERT